jgi:hypothetical protein
MRLLLLLICFIAQACAFGLAGGYEDVFYCYAYRIDRELKLGNKEDSAELSWISLQELCR